MNLRLPKIIAKLGGLLIAAGGIVNVGLGANLGSLFDDVPGGTLGLAGITSGVISIIIGLSVTFLVTSMYDRSDRGHVLIAGVMTIVLGYLGTVAGLMFVGTVGVVLCWVAGVWTMVVAAAGRGRRDI
jgi:hypothetical protein